MVSIDLFDDGSTDFGLLFLVTGGSGHWAGVGVNDSVAPGQYYFRTDAVAGNRGLRFPHPAMARLQPLVGTAFKSLSPLTGPIQTSIALALLTLSNTLR